MRKKLKLIFGTIILFFVLYLLYGGVLSYCYNHVYSTTQKITYIANHANEGFPETNKALLQSENFKKIMLKLVMVVDSNIIKLNV